MEKAIIAPRSEFQEKYLNTNADIIVAGGSYGCVPAETEFLTPTGWKKISDYQEGDKVGTAKLDSRISFSISFEEPLRYIKASAKELISLKCGKIVKTLSPEHMAVYYDREINLRVEKWSSILTKLMQRERIYLSTSDLEGDVAYNTSHVDLIKEGYSITNVPTTDGYKYCFETSTNLFLIRQGGNIFVTGNSSKSYIGLMRHLRWVHDKHYRGYTIRKNSTTLMKAGGLFEEAYQMYSAFDPGLKMRIKDQKLVFSTGASVSFSHYENSKSSEIYRGLQLSSVFYDEATDAAEEDIWFLIGRLRTQAKMTPSIWLTCNPNPDSYLRNWVDWWLYPEGHPQAGLPNPERNGVIRYMVRLDGQLYWGASKKIVIEKWGNPDLPHDHKKQIKPMSFTCLFGTIRDNPVLMDTNPNYVATLEALPEVDKQRYLYGNWNVRPMGSQFFEREWVEEVSDIDPSEIVSTARAFDFAGTLKSDINLNPDYTASVRMHKLKDGTYYIDEVTRTRIRPGKWKEFVLDLALGDPLGTTYYIPQDPGPAAKRACNLFIRELISHGLSARRMSTNKSKLDRFRPFSSMAQSGGIKVKKGCASDRENDIENDNRFYYKEMEAFDGKSSNAQHKHDDRQTCRL